MLIKFKTFEEAEENILFQSPTLENLMRIYEIFEAMDNLCQIKREVKRGLLFYKSWKDALLDEDPLGQ